LNESKEYFGSSLYQWTKEDYESQWRDAIKTLLDGQEKAALITEYVGPEAATHLEWWPMYVVGSAVFIQNHLLFYDQLSEPFSMQKAVSFLRERRTTALQTKKGKRFRVVSQSAGCRRVRTESFALVM